MISEGLFPEEAMMLLEPQEALMMLQGQRLNREEHKIQKLKPRQNMEKRSIKLGILELDMIKRFGFLVEKELTPLIGMKGTLKN